MRIFKFANLNSYLSLTHIMKNHSAIKIHYRACNLCEAICGLVIEHRDGEIISIKGDKEDPFSKGHICPKALALEDIYHDPNRLRTPIKRTDKGWEEISWPQAYKEVGTNIKRIQKEFGDDAIAFYQGNPTVHNYGSMLFNGNLRKALRTKNNYSATSLDQLPHQYVAQLMFGHPLMIPVPDIDHTNFFLIIGGNPLVSNGSMMTAPGISKRIKGVQDRGGKVVVIDPKRTETAKKSDQHIFIRPETDVYLILALINEVFSNNWVNLKQAKTYATNLNSIKNISLAYTPEKVTAITGIGSEEIRTLAREFCEADSAVCYGRMGVSVQKFGTICQWLMNVLNIITGNLDSPGGHMFTTPAVPIRRGKTRKSIPRWYSRVSKKAEIMGELPMAVMAEEMLTAGDGKIRGFIVSAGNPVISSANSNKLAEALQQLDYMVAIDIYLNDTTKHANIILPPATGLEVDHYDLAFYNLSVRNTAKYSPALFTPGKDSQYDWQIFKALGRLIKKNYTLKDRINDWWQTPTRLLNIGLKTGPYSRSHKLSLKKLKANPHGIDLGELKSILPAQLFTEDKKINLAHDILIAGMDEVNKNFRPTSSNGALKLISRRNLRSNNSWMQNIERLAGGNNKCTLQMNYVDAEKKNLLNARMVNVSSDTGSINVDLEITDEIMPGVVSLPHGWTNTDKIAGANINDLTNEAKTDSLTGNADFSGVEVKVEVAS